MGALFPTVKELVIYPLKSGQGIPLQWSRVTEDGLEFDRLWMLVDAQTREQFTQRERGGEKLTSVVTYMEATSNGGEKAVIFRTPTGRLAVSNPNLRENLPVHVILHGNTVFGLDAGDEAAGWFSDYVGHSVRLVRFPDDYKRSLETRFYQPQDRTAFADGGPMLVTGTASLDSLQPHFKAGADIDMRRFRPNIVIEGLKPWEEDAALEMRIGDVLIEITKPCARCPMPNVNQVTGERGAEPNKTLGRLRLGEAADGLERKFFFGQNAATRMPGIIHVGDRVEITQYRKDGMHAALKACAVKYTP